VARLRITVCRLRRVHRDITGQCPHIGQAALTAVPLDRQPHQGPRQPAPDLGVCLGWRNIGSLCPIDNPQVPPRRIAVGQQRARDLAVVVPAAVECRSVVRGDCCSTAAAADRGCRGVLATRRCTASYQPGCSTTGYQCDAIPVRWRTSQAGTDDQRDESSADLHPQAADTSSLCGLHRKSGTSAFATAPRHFAGRGRNDWHGRVRRRGSALAAVIP